MGVPPTLDWPPEFAPVAPTRWQLTRAAGIAAPWSGTYDVTDYGWGLHRCEATFTGAGGGRVFDMFAFEAFVWSLAGGIRPVLVPRWDRGLGPRGGITLPRPTVAGANQIGHSIAITGISGANPVLRKGDVIEIESHLYMCRTDVNEVGGNATLVLDPPVAIGRPPADGATVTFGGIYQGLTPGQTARADMIMVTPAATAFRAPAIGTVTLEFQEIFL